MRRKIARLYGELRFLEDEITGGGGPTDAVQLMARLDQLEKQANQLKMPIAYESMMYLLRNHIGVVRNRLAVGQPVIISRIPRSDQRERTHNSLKKLSTSLPKAM